MEEINAREVANLDQAAAASKSMAIFLGEYLRNLCGQGFTRPEAIQIILGYQQWLLSHGKKADD